MVAYPWFLYAYSSFLKSKLKYKVVFIVLIYTTMTAMYPIYVQGVPKKRSLRHCSTRHDSIFKIFGTFPVDWFQLEVCSSKIKKVLTVWSLIMDFGCKFLNARQPALCHVRRIYKKTMELGTVLNMNSKTSPGNSFSGRSRLVAE